MEDFKYYTLFGVNLSHDNDMIPKFSRDFIMRWTSNERENSKFAKSLSDDQLFKMDQMEAMNVAGIGQEGCDIIGIKTRLMFCPEISAHLFETNFVMTDEYVDIMIELANIDKSGRELLAKAKIKI